MAQNETSGIHATVLDLQKALRDFDQIPEGEPSEVEQLKTKTRELIVQLNEQIRQLGL